MNNELNENEQLERSDDGRSDDGLINEILTEHNKSLKMILSITSKMELDINLLRTRVADMEAKLAYYVSEKENGNRIIQ